MKKADLKQLIKPLVKECIHEVLIEEGLLSSVVSEVAKGMQGNMVMESQQQKTPQTFDDAAFRETKTKEVNTRLFEQRKKMMDAIGQDAYNGVNLFEGTAPMKNASPNPGTPDMGRPHDSGVDISSLVGDASAVWKAMK
jgi:flagellin-like hook-associated protein FlgL